MDARNMEFIPDQCFDLIIDKGTVSIFGVLMVTFDLILVCYACLPHYSYFLSVLSALFDAVLCSENNLKDIQSLLKEMYRVLKMGGVYLMISHGPPDNRVNHIKRYIDVDIDVVPIRKCRVR